MASLVAPYRASTWGVRRRFKAKDIENLHLDEPLRGVEIFS